MIPQHIEKILDLARWAPSGDNTQPWNFEILDDRRFVIYGRDTRDWCVYDLDGRASQIAIGALMENIAIAASEQGLSVEFISTPNASERHLTINVELTENPGIRRDPLVEYITKRVTQRRPLSTTSLTDEQKRELEDSVGANYKVAWIEGAENRWRMAKLLFDSAKIRLTIPEAYEVHRRVIAWDSQFSEDKIPDQAVGLNSFGLALMRWAMKSWKRVSFLNKFLAGTWLPRIQLDLAPGYFCSSHFLISTVDKKMELKNCFEAGRATQRFWLTTTQMGLQLQPEMTPLIFSRYANDRLLFTSSADAIRKSLEISIRMHKLFGKDSIIDGVFMGRIGYGPTPASRSTRRPLHPDLLQPQELCQTNPGD